MNRSVVLIVLFALLPSAKSDFHYLIHVCSNTTAYPPNSTYATDLRNVLAKLSNSSTTHFNNASTKTRERIQAFYQCRNDISLQECTSCVSTAIGDVLDKCPIEKTAVIWYDECLLRFSNETIVSALSTSPTWYMRNGKTVPVDERALFNGFVRSDLNDCATEAANSPLKFAARERNKNINLSITDRIYYFVQCTADLSKDDCSRCLDDALGAYPSCCSSAVGARLFNPSCDFRFETYSFYDVSAITPASSPSSSPSPSPNAPFPPSLSFNGTRNPRREKNGLSKLAITLILISLGLLAVIFCIGCFVFIRRRRSPNKLQEIGPMKDDSLVFSLRVLKAATNNFSSQNLLGQGGYGDVFKGTLESGNEIAVKRLGESSSQGETEFKTEVSLVANLQHRNLTRLLGFCVEGQERILVIEYLHNKSLDRFLFEKEQGALEWAQRYNIIQGIARGMLYLHEDSRFKIIHRDLKASNILLDGYLNPKISDFGTAKICGINETRAMTHRVIGTRCYMAPEYALHGTFSVKSDVYSFGVLMLEIVTGLKATKSRVNDDYGDLIDFVWKHWREERVTEVVDKGMKQSYSEQEVMRCIHVALLCVQYLPSERPTMATVVRMLNRNSATEKVPKQPFINYFSLSKSSESKSRSLLSQ